jgi:tetratricopeptide (TPR) repeat protein
MAIWPSGLAVFYPHPGPWLPAWKVAGAALLLAGITGWALAQRRRRPYLAAGWLWYLVTLVPVIGIVQVGRQALADRYAYVPLMGVFIAVAWGASELATRLPRPLRARVLAVASCVSLAALGICAWRQAGYWRDEITLYERTLAVTENNDFIHAMIAQPLFRQGRVDETLWHLRESLRINPVNDAAENNVGLILLDRGRGAEAATHFRAALRLNPANAKAHFNLARTLVAEGRREEARAHLREAVRIDPAYENPRRLLAQLDAGGQGGR